MSVPRNDIGRQRSNGFGEGSSSFLGNEKARGVRIQGAARRRREKCSERGSDSE